MAEPKRHREIAVAGLDRSKAVWNGQFVGRSTTPYSRGSLESRVDTSN